MFKNLKWVRYVPDRSGKGGIKSGFHSFQAGPINETRSCSGFHVYRGRWRRDYSAAVPTQIDDLAGVLTPMSCHGYVYPSTTNPAAAPGLTLLGHNIGGGFSRYWDFTSGTLRDSHSANAIAATFVNVSGRCFAADGAREGFIFDDRTPAIHAQPNQNLGIGTPTQPFQSSSALDFAPGIPGGAKIPNLTGYGLAYVMGNAGVGHSILHTPNPDSPMGLVDTSEVVTVSLVSSAFPGITGAVPAAGNPASNGISSKANPTSAPFNVGADTISCIQGSNIITRSGAWPVGTGKVSGLAINFNGYSFMLGATDQDPAANQYDVNGNLITLAANQAVIYGTYNGPSVSNIPFTITGAELELTTSNTLATLNSVTLGYNQSTLGKLVPVLISSIGNTNVWFCESAAAANKIGVITPGGVITEYAITTAAAGASKIAQGSDNNMWFTEAAVDKIGKITSAGVVTEFAVTAAAGPLAITAGPDGNLWFTEPGLKKIGKITVGGIVSEYATGIGGVPRLEGICVGSDGNLWFTAGGVDQVGRITTLGNVTLYSTGAGTGPFGICNGPNGNLWFTCWGSGQVGEITTGGTVTLHGGLNAAAKPKDICVGPDGNLWFTEDVSNMIGTMTTAGAVTEFAIPTAASAPYGIVSGRDGNVWFVEQANPGKIGKCTTAGVITEYATTSVNSLPIGLASGGFVRNMGNISLSGPSAGIGIATSPAPWGGPTYAYAWYDPETGHMSNISPLTKIATPPAITASAAVKDYQNVTPYFPIDIGKISYPSGSTSSGDYQRFSHIVVFRTLSESGASTLFPIGSLQPFVAKATYLTRGNWNPGPLSGWLGIPNMWVDGTTSTGNYFYDFSSDADLLLSGGFRAPQETNSKPMVSLRGGATEPGKPAYMAYWDGRTWLTNTQTPDVINYSCDDRQCPLGIPQESFPPTNFLRIPAEDGRVLGMRKFGEMLVITTERWAYTVAGNNESNYRLMRVSASMPGVGNYQMDEMPSDIEGAPSTIFYLGRDKIVYQWVPGGSPVPISSPVQDIINTELPNTAAGYMKARVHCVSAWSRRLVVLTVAPATFFYTPLIFDIDNKVWTTNPTDDGNADPIFGNTTSPYAYTSVYGLDPPIQELYMITFAGAGGSALRSWIADNTGTLSTISGGAAIVSTFPSDFDGIKKRKQLVAVNLHVSAGGAGTWTVQARANEGLTKTSTAVPYTTPGLDALYSVYTAGQVPIDSSTAQDLVAMTATFNTDGSAMIGYRFSFNIRCTSTAVPTELYAFDVCYVDWEEDGEGDA